eukprot:CAMPEP_0118994688 /NCGR_PEP_ID=MMETSP1173-20130426/57218_1 /TAXON_ID=1034831 /ORGANISM="Rhizochromulina marina cf, Strain CCMP1243" /LENGTH=112 /DNA_ID=CAMNT_0006945997 /DNA_START=16 /DNA_END=354 /DNA_ORIENTATION=+
MEIRRVAGPASPQASTGRRTGMPRTPHSARSDRTEASITSLDALQPLRVQTPSRAGQLPTSDALAHGTAAELEEVFPRGNASEGSNAGVTTEDVDIDVPAYNGNGNGAEVEL